MKNNGFKRISALILAAAVFVSAMSGCGKSKRASDAASSGAASGSTSATGLKDTFTYAQGSDPRGLDPALVDDGESAKVMCNIYEGLLKYNKNSTEVEPCLATDWNISPDGTKYTFHLRKGVKFQDGTGFNADAVKKSIDRQLEPNVTDNMPYASFVFGSKKKKSGVKEVKVIDDHTVEIDLFSAETPFLKNLAMIMAAPIVSPTALKKYNNLNEHPVGTGPYTFVSWEKGQYIKLKKNDNYWGDKAKTENVVFRFIKENSARDVALTSGEVDAIDGISSNDVSQITSSGDRLFSADGMNINYMAYNVTSQKFKSAAARKAFSEAINVPELVKSLYKDYATPATSIMPKFMNPDGFSSIKQTPFNKAAAKADFAKAGIKSVNMITYSNPRPYNSVGGQMLAEAIQGYLKDVGVTCNVKTYDWTSYTSVVKKGDYDICFYGWVGDNGDADNFMNLLDDSDPSMNVARYSVPAYHELIAKGLMTPNGAERTKIYTQCEQKVAEDDVWLPISHSNNLAAYSPKVSGYYCHQTGVTPFAGVTVTK